MDYTFYFVNNNRVISEWSGCLESRDAAEWFANGAAVCAAMTYGEIGVYGVSESEKQPICRQMTDKRANVLFAYIEEKTN